MNQFEESDNLTCQETVAAYVERDDSMNLELDIEKFTHDMTKLGFNPDEVVIRKEYNAFIRYQTRQALQNNQDLSVMISFDEYYQQKHQMKQNKWNQLYEAFETNNKEIYYQAFSLNELKYLGY